MRRICSVFGADRQRWETAGRRQNTPEFGNSQLSVGSCKPLPGGRLRVRTARGGVRSLAPRPRVQRVRGQPPGIEVSRRPTGVAGRENPRRSPVPAKTLSAPGRRTPGKSECDRESATRFHIEGGWFPIPFDLLQGSSQRRRRPRHTSSALQEWMRAGADSCDITYPVGRCWPA